MAEHPIVIALLVAVAAIGVFVAGCRAWSWVFDDNDLETSWQKMLFELACWLLWPISVAAVLIWFGVPEIWKCTRWYKLRQKKRALDA